MKTDIILSIVVPVYNEEKNILNLFNNISSNIIKHGGISKNLETLIIYDFDQDNTIPVIRKNIENYLKLNIKLVKNNYGAGVINAIKKGFNSASGKYILVLMADLSDDITIVIDMINKLDSGFDIVCGSRYIKGGKQIGGLQSIIADSPATGVVGGINAANFAFWRNQVESVNTPSSSNITGGMNLLFNKLVRGNDRPKIIVADSIFYNHYESSLQANQRFASDVRAGAGFETLVFKGNVPVILDDSGIPASRMYFINTDYLTFDVHKDAYMTPTEALTPINQDSIVQNILLQGNLTCSNRALQGVLKPE